MAQDYTLFGPNVQEAQQGLDASYLQQAMLTAQHSPALANNPFYLPSTSALINKSMDQVGSLFGAQPPEIKKAYEMEAIQKEVDAAGIDFEADPIGYAKLAASKMLAKGYRKEALSAMQWALDSGVKLSEMQKNLGAGKDQNDYQQARATVMQWLQNEEVGLNTPEADRSMRIALEKVERAQFSEGGSENISGLSVRAEVLEKLQARGMGAPKQQQPQQEEQSAVTTTPYTREEPQPRSAYEVGVLPKPGGGYEIPSPTVQTRKLAEETSRVRNQLDSTKVMEVVKAFSDVENVIKPYITSGKDLPGLGTWESMLTQGIDEEGKINYRKKLGRLGYNIAEGAGVGSAKEANRLLQTIDALMAMDISAWAGASQTTMEAARQNLAKALTAGASTSQVVAALSAYKEVLRTSLSKYFGGLDPKVREKFMNDPGYGEIFNMLLNPQPFGIISGLPKGIPEGSTAVGVDAEGNTIYKAPNGKTYREKK